MTQIREVDIENIVEFFNNNKYTKVNLNKLNNIELLVIDLIDYFFIDYKGYKNISEFNPNFVRTYYNRYYKADNVIYINPLSYDKVYFDVNKIEFKNLYPNVICKLLEEYKINFNIKEYEIIYYYMVKNKKIIISKLTNNSKYLFNSVINSLFYSNKYIFISDVDKNSISFYLKNFETFLLNNTDLLLFYIDIIFISNKNIDIIQAELDKLELPYDKKTLDLYIKSPFEYIINDDCNIKYSNKLMNKNEDIENIFNNKNRKSKISKLIINNQ